MRRRLHHEIARLILVVGCTVLLIGCGSEEAPSTAGDLSGPWQSEPFALDSATVAAADGACRAGGGVGTAPLVGVDARGGGVVVLIHAQGGTLAYCVVARGAGGRFASWESGLSEGPPVPPIGLRTFDIQGVSSTSGGGDAGGALTYVIGRAGADVASLQIDSGTGTQLRASLSGTGWFVGWWPGDTIKPGIQPIIRAYDAAGNFVATNE